jgi:hypothetical protein
MRIGTVPPVHEGPDSSSTLATRRLQRLLDGLGVEAAVVLEGERKLALLEVHLDRPLLYPR